MAKKMRLFKHKNPPQDPQPSVSSYTSRQHSSWVPCREQPKTLSFRAIASPVAHSKCTTDTLTKYLVDEEAELESVIQGARMVRSSDRLFFSPEKSNSILKKTKAEHNLISTAQEENAALINTLTMESVDPYMDFRSSMEEMIEAHRLHDWDLLEDLLGCYLMLNEKKNHCYIIRAFADLVVKPHFAHLTNSYSTSVQCSPCDDVTDSFVTSFSSPLHLSSTSTTAETSCSSSSIAPAEVRRRGGEYSNVVNVDNS